MKDLKMNDSGFSVDLKPNGKCSDEKRREHRDTKGEGDHIKEEAEDGDMWPQAKECLGSSEAGRDKKDYSPET